MLLTFLCLGIACVEGQLLHKSAAHFALFGKINTLDDLFLPEEADESDTNITTAELRDLLDDSVQIGNIEDQLTINNINKSTILRDERDFNDINLKMYKSTRKRLYGGILFTLFYNKQYDPEDNATWDKESHKLKMLQDFSLQFLLHSRKKVEGAFEQRQKVRKDKRYKLGYLFNRLRRIKIEMNKILYQTNKIEEGTFKVAEMRRLNGMMRYYERIVRLDVDVRDTCELIRFEYNVTARFDRVKQETEQKEEKPKVNG